MTQILVDRPYLVFFVEYVLLFSKKKIVGIIVLYVGLFN